ncbi:MAG: hypothetical protein N4A65_00670 [Cohaesibacter sp.]|nr:hypothetical protein [Cohaesibacter sp.]
MMSENHSTADQVAKLALLEIETLRMLRMAETASEPFIAYLMNMALIDIGKRLATLSNQPSEQAK